MKVYHLGHTRFARSLNGEGARLHGGRWNKVGTPCLYTSESAALCVLEYSANVSLEALPQSLSITVYELPLKSWMEPDEGSLPQNWHQVPAPEETKVFGTSLLQNLQFAAIKVPSAIIPSEYNYIINPLADNFNTVKILNVYPFYIDRRIKS